MRTQEFKLPNGVFVGGEVIKDIEFRRLDGEDEDFLRDKEELRKGNTFFRLLNRCIMRVGTVTKKSKPLEEDAAISEILKKGLLLADLTFMLVKLRQWSIDSIYRFEDACSHCDKPNWHRLDLSTLPETEQPADCVGKKEFMDVVDGVPITFGPLYAVKDVALLELIKTEYPKEKASRELLLQLKMIGEKPAGVDNVKHTEGDTMGPMAWRHAVRLAMDAKMGGIETELINECRHCNRTYKTNMPVETKYFFFQAAETAQTRTAYPFRVYGRTFGSLETASIGSPVKSEPSPSKSESGTSPA